MTISGIYAGTAQVTSGQFYTGRVDIEIETYKLNNQNEEVKFDDGDNKTVIPGDVISFIPKIHNVGESCYLRTKITYVDEKTDVTQYIINMSNDWMKYGDYFYYDKILNSGETVKLFDKIKIPEDIKNSTNDKNINIEILCETVQEKNFMPNYEEADPWKSVTPQKNINSEYNIDTGNNSNITIKYQNGANNDVIVPDNLFDDIKSLMPGNSYNSNIEIKNTNKNNVDYYLIFSIEKDAENYEKKSQLLSKLNLTITNKDGKTVYNGKMTENNKILLGTYKINENDVLNLKISVPNELENTYASLNPQLTMLFSAGYDANDNTNPETGDKINIAMTIFLISSIGLIVVMILNYKEKKKNE